MKTTLKELQEQLEKDESFKKKLHEVFPKIELPPDWIPKDPFAHDTEVALAE